MNDHDQSSSESLIQRLFRRAAKILRFWNEPNSVDTSPAPLPLDHTDDFELLLDDLDSHELALDTLTNDAPEISLAAMSQLSTDEFFERKRLCNDYVETSPEPTHSVTNVFEYLDRTEAQIVRLLQAYPGLKAKQIADKLKMQKQDVNRVLYDNLSAYVECDDSYCWRLSAQ